MVVVEGSSKVRGHLRHLQVLEQVSSILQHYHLTVSSLGEGERGGERESEGGRGKEGERKGRWEEGRNRERERQGGREGGR